MKYAVEMGSGVFIPSFKKIGLGIQKLIRAIHTRTHRQQGDLISLLLCFSLLSCFKKIEQTYEITLLSVCVCLCIPLIVARQRLRFLCGSCRIKGK
jgi:hypothetical protein